MKINSIILVAIMAVFSFCACTQEVEVQTDRMLSVKVELPGQSTRATVEGLNTTFTEYDEIGIYIVDDNNNIVADNLACWLTSEGVWDLFFTDSPNLTNCRFFAYYPMSYDISVDSLNLSATTSTEFFSKYIRDFTPLEDQSTLDDYMASDLMTSKGTYDSSSGTVTFAMDHEMGLAIINVYEVNSDDASENLLTDLTDFDIIQYMKLPVPYKMTTTDTDAYYLIVHPAIPLEVYLDFTDATAQQNSTTINVDRGKYTTYNMKIPGN